MSDLSGVWRHTAVAEPSCTWAGLYRPLYQKYSIGTTVYSPLARGVLTGKVRPKLLLVLHAVRLLNGIMPSPGICSTTTASPPNPGMLSTRTSSSSGSNNCRARRAARRLRR